MKQQVQPQLWARKIKKLTGVDVYNKQRTNEVIEYRAVLNVMMYKHLKMSLTDIARHYQANGRKSHHHASVLHSINKYDQYRQWNPNLDKVLGLCISGDEQYVDIRKKLVFMAEYVDPKYFDELIPVLEHYYEETLKSLEIEEV